MKIQGKNCSFVTRLHETEQPQKDDESLHGAFSKYMRLHIVAKIFGYDGV